MRVAVLVSFDSEEEELILNKKVMNINERKICFFIKISPN